MNQMNRLILFDGHCNLCNQSVQFILKHEKKKDFLFASLQSEKGKSILRKHNLPDDYTESVLFLDGEKLYTKSTAALKICASLKFPWHLLRVFHVVPKFLRDWVYGWIAKNRLRWFGETESCWVMTPEYKARFLN
jgi:predicted DCC family thiol-disulfide oxidoreductase YuxK